MQSIPTPREEASLSIVGTGYPVEVGLRGDFAAKPPHRHYTLEGWGREDRPWGWSGGMVAWGAQWMPPPGFKDQYGVVRYPRFLGKECVESGEGDSGAPSTVVDDKFVLLVRHGQSCSNVGAQPKGRVDPLLTTLGTLQARELKGRLEARYGPEALGVSRVLVSPMARALQTSALLFAGTVHASRLEIEPCLRERGVGMAENIPRAHADTAELCKTYEDSLGVRFHGVDRLDCPDRDASIWDPDSEERRLRAGGLSVDEEKAVEGRMDDALLQLLREAPAGERFALVCHFGSILSVCGRPSDNCEGLWVRLRFLKGAPAGTPFDVELLERGPDTATGRPPWTGPRVQQARQALCAGLRAAWGGRPSGQEEGLAERLFGDGRAGVDAALEPPGVLLDLDYASAAPVVQGNTVVMPLQATTLARLGDTPHVVVGRVVGPQATVTSLVADSWAPPPARRIGTLSLADLGDRGFALRGELGRVARAFAAQLEARGALQPARDGELCLAWGPCGRRSVRGRGPDDDDPVSVALVPFAL